MKKLRIIFICLILAACIAPSLLMVCGYKNANRENRVLARFPKLFTEDGSNTEFTKKFDSYVDDHFAFKDILVSAFNNTDIAVLHDFNGTNAVIGKENHIFYGETVDDYLGVDQLTQDQIDAIANYLTDVQNRFAIKKTRFAFLIAPNKATIYPEYMPDYLKPDEEASHNIDMLKKAMKRRDINFIDAKQILTDAKATNPVYYEHDSHWNNYGAMLVYNSTADLMGLEQYDPEVYTVVKDRTGDLHNFVYPATSYLEERIVYPEFHEYKSKRPVDFDRDKLVETHSEVNDKVFVMYHDSFGRSLQPIFSQSVGSLYMNSYFPYDLDFAEEKHPDFVVIELVERNLDKLYEHARSLGYSEELP